MREVATCRVYRFPVSDELFCIHQVQTPCNLRCTELSLEGDVRLGRETALGGDHDDTVRTSGSVDRCGRGVLQHRDALDVFRVDVIEVGHCTCHSVHDDERLIRGCDGTGSADTDGSRCTRFTGCGHDIHSRDTSLEGLVYGQAWSLLHIRHLHTSDRAGEVRLLHLSITDHYNLVQRVVRVREELHLDVTLSENIDILRQISEKGYRNSLIIGSDIEGEGSLLVSHRSALAVLRGNNRSDERNTHLIHHLTRDLSGLGRYNTCCQHRCQQQGHKPKESNLHRSNLSYFIYLRGTRPHRQSLKSRSAARCARITAFLKQKVCGSLLSSSRFRSQGFRLERLSPRSS